MKTNHTHQAARLSILAAARSKLARAEAAVVGTINPST